MQISILNGVYTDRNGYVRTTYPVNMRPVPKDSGLSAGYMRPAEGVKQFASKTGKCRGGVNWQGFAYFVIDDALCKVLPDGSVTELGNVENDGAPVSFAFSFDRLGIASANKMFYLQDDALAEVTDSDIGDVLDCVWLDGYFLTTDGDFIIAAELSDPTDINPYKYGSSEVDPDPITRLLINRNELYAVNRYTIEVFSNVGGEFFPFTRLRGAHIQRGAVGRKAACKFNEAIAFVGGGRDEAISVYMGENAQSVRISTNEIDKLIGSYSEQEIAAIITEPRTDEGHSFLYIHLPDRTLVYDSGASNAMGAPVWFVLSSGASELSEYRARYFVRAYGKWLCGDPDGNGIGVLTDDASHWGQHVGMEFSTMYSWSETGGAIIHELELYGTPGRVEEPTSISMTYSDDGVVWSQDRWIPIGKTGDRLARMCWRRVGKMEGVRAFKFRTDSRSQTSFMRLEAKVEPLVK